MGKVKDQLWDEMGEHVNGDCAFDYDPVEKDFSDAIMALGFVREHLSKFIAGDTGSASLNAICKILQQELKGYLENRIL